MSIASKRNVRQNRKEVLNWLIQNKAVLPGEGAALLCAFFYSCIYNQNCVPFPKKMAAAILIALFFHIVNLAARSDSSSHKIPNQYCCMIVLLVFAATPVMTEISLGERLAGGGIVSIPMLMLSLWKKGSFGGGDIKFMGVCGTFWGVEIIWKSFVLSVIMSAIYGICLLLRGRTKDALIPIGVFLQMGMLLEVFLFAWNIWKG